MAGFGTQIIATDYNAIQSKISNILGTGSVDYGYGQAVTSSQVARNNKITVAQWNALRNDLLKARQHQTGNDESGLLVLPTTSTTIKEVDRAAYNTFADIATSNRLTIPPATQGSLANFTVATRTSPWSNKHVNIGKKQSALQETESTNYVIGVMSDNVMYDELPDL